VRLSTASPKAHTSLGKLGESYVSRRSGHSRMVSRPCWLNGAIITSSAAVFSQSERLFSVNGHAELKLESFLNRPAALMINLRGSLERHFVLQLCGERSRRSGVGFTTALFHALLRARRSRFLCVRVRSRYISPCGRGKCELSSIKIKLL
jgi:hypothetical protein